MNARQLIAASVYLCVAWSPVAVATPLLGATAQGFAVLAAAGVTSSGTTTITGNLGSAPTGSVSGFPPGIVTGGIITGSTVAQQARGDALAAYGFLAAQAPTQVLTGTDLGGLTLGQGVYRFAGSAQLTGILTLDALGDPNAVFVFEIGSTLTTAPGALVSVINGGSGNGLFWQVGSSATLGDGTLFAGNILADTSITLDPFARITCGRALAGIVTTTGAVTLANGNQVAIEAGAGCAGGYGGGYEATSGGGFRRILAGGPAPVPEPRMLPLLAAGLAGLVLVRRRRAAAVDGQSPDGPMARRANSPILVRASSYWASQSKPT